MATRKRSGMTTSASVPDNGGDHSGGGGSGGTFVDDVFSTYLYTGSGADRDIVNGVDLDGEGGLVWLKSRSFDQMHALVDTEQGAGKNLASDWNGAQNNSPDYLTSFNSEGFSLGTSLNINKADEEFTSWSFRKQPSFFDVVTWTGDGVKGRDIPHSLGIAPGMIIVKRYSGGDEDWYVYHRSMGGAASLLFNKKFGRARTLYWNDTDPTDTVFTVGELQGVNKDGSLYVAYLFAHDPDPEEGMIQCGSYWGNSGSTGKEIDLGWEPQWVMIKNTSSDDDWTIYDTMRGIVTGDSGYRLWANQAKAESAYNNAIDVTSTGFKKMSALSNASGNEYIYMAIRRPNKPASEFEPDELFAVGDRRSVPASEPQVYSGFPVDFALRKRVTVSQDNQAYSRFMGTKKLSTNTTSQESGVGGMRWDYMDGYWEGDGGSADPNEHSWMWRRAHGYFDVVCYEGDSQSGRDVPHNLGVKPEMMWVKSRTAANTDWYVYVEAVEEANNGEPKGAKLNADYGFNFTPWVQHPTNEDFHLGIPIPDLNTTGNDYIAYLFASVPGICDIGTYTGNGNNQNIDCGFTNGARFVLIKRTDAAGDWWFTVDPSNHSMLAKLNDSAAASDQKMSIAHWENGFNVQQRSITNFNVDNATYIYYAIA